MVKNEITNDEIMEIPMSFVKKKSISEQIATVRCSFFQNIQ